MAELLSQDANEKIELRPVRLESLSEDWVICQIMLRRGNRPFLNTTAAFLQTTELELLTRSVNDLLGQRVSHVDLAFIEPNFLLTINTKDSTYIVNATYYDTIDYHDGKILNSPKSSNNLVKAVRR
jgi:hypothetical protein